MEKPHLDPVAAVAMLLAILALALYLWLESQKGTGGSEPTGWFVGGLALGVVVTGYACVSSARHRRVALAGAGLLLAPMAPLSTVSFSVATSRPSALFWAYGTPLAIAGILALLRSWLHGPWRRASTLAAASIAAVTMVASLAAAAEEAARGEGEVGMTHANLILLR